MATNSSNTDAKIKIEDILQDNAGKNFKDDGTVISSNGPVKPYTNESSQEYRNVRKDSIESVLTNSSKLSYTEKLGKGLRLLMPQYGRRVEIEDLDRNFWVLGNGINAIIDVVNNNLMRIENTLETDNDETPHNYSEYSHKIVFNEGYETLRTPYLVKDYIKHHDVADSNGSTITYGNDSIWYRQMGGYTDAANGYWLGSGSSTPMFNFYKPRPDAIPLFEIIQTESSDTESQISDSHDYSGIGAYNFKGKVETALTHQGTETVTYPYGGTQANGDVVISNVSELTPITVEALPQGENFVKYYEGQIVKLGGTYYVKRVTQQIVRHGIRFPSTYAWKPTTEQLDLTTPDSEQRKLGGALYIKNTDQRFYWNGTYWVGMDARNANDGPTPINYAIIENGPMRNVLGDSATVITNGGNQKPTINGEAIELNKIKDLDVVRYNGVCYERWNNQWSELRQYDQPFVNICLFFSSSPSYVRGVYYWTLKWLIPLDKGV